MANSTNKSDNLSIGDVVSFIAILLMGVMVFFGVNFWSLGDRVQSVIIAILLVILLIVPILLAGYAKGQNRNQTTWKKIEYSMIVLYFIALIPTMLFSAKFCAIQFNKSDIISQTQRDMDDINRGFAEYEKLCKSRSLSYQTALEAMATTREGREKIANTLGISVSQVNESSIAQAGENFFNKLHGLDYSNLNSERHTLENNVVGNIKNWNIILVPQYASELGSAKEKYAKELKRIYDATTNDLEKEIPPFKEMTYMTSNNHIAEQFHDLTSLSLLGVLLSLILGLLGFVKYVSSPRRTVIEITEGEITTITNDGGIAL